jgi:hypothetical protein
MRHPWGGYLQYGFTSLNKPQLLHVRRNFVPWKIKQKYPAGNFLEAALPKENKYAALCNSPQLPDYRAEFRKQTA